MRYKKADRTIGFADLPLISSIEHNRSVKMAEKIRNELKSLEKEETIKVMDITELISMAF